MFTNHVRKYSIDLSVEPQERWAQVIERERGAARRLADEALTEAEEQVRSSLLMQVGSWGLGLGYRLAGGLYVDEISAWASALDLSVGEVTSLNCSYELSHAAETLGFDWRRLIVGCTAGARWLDGLGMVHVRNMDWELSNIGNATRLFHFKDGGREFYSVGIAGFVGVISGMVPGAYSVTINWAPPVGRPRFSGWGPAFLLRDVLEQCDTYAEAVEVLASTALSTPVFFMVCGTSKSQACVIERRKDTAAIRRIRGGALVQANHHIARKFRDQDHYWDDAEDNDTFDRARALQSQLSDLRANASLDDAAACLDAEPVVNERTVQQMAFCPASGEIRVWRRTGM